MVGGPGLKTIFLQCKICKGLGPPCLSHFVSRASLAGCQLIGRIISASKPENLAWDGEEPRSNDLEAHASAVLLRFILEPVSESQP